MPLVAGTYGGVSLSATQVMHANTIIGIGQSRAIPAKGIVIALMTAMQESRMGTMGMTRATDHDSLGLFQQRPSQGWGTPAQVMNTTYATNKFYDALVKVPGWQLMPATAAAQAVQRSAYPGAYGKWQAMAEAALLAAGSVGGAASGGPVSGGGAAVEVAPVSFGNIGLISEPATWKRIGFFLLGVLLLIVGLFKITGDNKLSPITKAIGKAVIKRRITR